MMMMMMTYIFGYRVSMLKKIWCTHVLCKHTRFFKYFNSFYFTLEETEKQLTKEKEEKRILLRDKNNEIGTLQQRINSLEGSYEGILHVSISVKVLYLYLSIVHVLNYTSK